MRACLISSYFVNTSNYISYLNFYLNKCKFDYHYPEKESYEELMFRIENKIYKKKGALVKRGESIGAVGNSGNVKIPQLHFEIRKGKEAVDPLKYLS